MFKPRPKKMMPTGKLLPPSGQQIHLVTPGGTFPLPKSTHPLIPEPTQTTPGGVLTYTKISQKPVGIKLSHPNSPTHSRKNVSGGRGYTCVE